MKPLIRIQTTPIEYQLKIEAPRLEMRQAQNPSNQVKQTPSSLQIHTKNIQVRLDTSEMRNSIGLKSAPDLIADAAAYGKQTAMEATAEMTRFGDQIGQIQDGVTVAGLMKQKLLEQPDTMTVFLPSTGPAVSWDPNQMDVKYKPGDLEFDWKINQNILNYVPGKFQMVIEQYPKVQIEYLGDPNYVPPSAKPNYVGESA